MNKAEKILSEIEHELTGGESLKRYTRLDLVQFVWFWEKEKQKGKKIHECIAEYIPLWERTTAEEKLNNIANAFRLNEDVDEIDI